MYSSYTAASFARKHELAEKHGVNLEGALSWAFEFEGHPYFAGFRSLATNGIDKPVLNIFRMFSKMRGKRLKVTSDSGLPLEVILRDGVRETPDVSALASIDDEKVSVLVWHYHDEDVPGPAAAVTLRLNSLPTIFQGIARATHYRVDKNHSNAFTTWKNMGSPQQPTGEQYAELERSCKLEMLSYPVAVRVDNGAAQLTFDLPRAGVSLLTLEWKNKE